VRERYIYTYKEVFTNSRQADHQHSLSILSSNIHYQGTQALQQYPL